MNTNEKILIWRCGDCKSVKFSNPWRHHLMDFCDCDCSGVDLELYGERRMGNVVELESIGGFFNELLECARLQGFDDFFVKIGEQEYITLECSMKIGDLQDEIIKHYISETYG